MEEYPFRHEIEELISSPLGGLKEGEMMEEGEIVAHHSLPSLLASLRDKRLQEHVVVQIVPPRSRYTPL